MRVAANTGIIVTHTRVQLHKAPVSLNQGRLIQRCWNGYRPAGTLRIRTGQSSMENTNSMEHILVTQFIASLPVVLKPCYAPHQSFAQSLLRAMKDIICDRVLSLQSLKVLVEATTPLSKFSVGLNTSQTFEKDIKNCLPSPMSTCYVIPVCCCTSHLIPVQFL